MSPSLSSRLARLATRLGLTSRPPAPQHARERIGKLKLEFAPLPAFHSSIFWSDNPSLEDLHELPRGALSGPTQEYKARAHAILVKLIRRESEPRDAFDLREVGGFLAPNPLGIPCPSFETFAATPACRAIRIISYNDFMRVMDTAVPGYKAAPRVTLLQANWQGDRVFWAGDGHGEAFACAIAYARLRGLDLSLPCEQVRYFIDEDGLAALERAYHVLLMPEHAWNDREFMRHLLEDGTPYARLRLQRHNHEWLLLDKRLPRSDGLGIGLKKAGAADFCDYLRRHL
ncbi:DUF6685 family protein [Stutzerimonas tarimensis]|uniref:DUF6685 family protein n=1 Tax=Stutzerimonas tarimensis TaxID=1507735 RepID=A0ABV7T3E6_9GAMM